MKRREEILSRIDSVQLIPASALEVVQLLQDPDVGMDRIARAIEYDPGLTSNALRLSNSAHFGSSTPVKSIREAVGRLGTRQVFHLVVTAAIAPVAIRAVKGYDLPPGALWTHSIGVGVAAQRLAARSVDPPPSSLFTSAILHDVGKIVLGTFIEVDPAPILALAFEESVSFEKAEQQVIGIDHAEVGGLLLKRWKLPQDIVDVVRWHHQPEGAPASSVALDLVHTADVLCMMGGMGSGIDGLNYRPSPHVAARLRIKNRVAEGIICESIGEVEKLRTSFGVQGPA
jgi:putative nucleotidyltransferase with HDIG domain